VGRCGWRRGLSVRVAVIMAAWRAAPFIGEAIESWGAVDVPDGCSVDLRVGVDGCKQTAAALDALGVRYAWSRKNVGPYVIRNSLVAHGPADAYAIFDADDRVLPRYLLDLLPLLGKGIAAGGRHTIDEAGERTEGRIMGHVNGVCLISHAAWERVGPFLPWRVAADAEWHRRAKRLGVRKRTTATAVYERRRWPGALTQRPATGFRSPARLAAKAMIEEIHKPTSSPRVRFDRHSRTWVFVDPPPEASRPEAVTVPLVWR